MKAGGADLRLEILLEAWDGLKLIPRGHDEFMRIGLDDFAFCIDRVFGEEARPVEVEIRVERILEEQVDELCAVLRDVAVAHELADDDAVLAFGKGVIVAVAGPGLGEFGSEFIE